MKRPTERAMPGVVELTDDVAPDFIDAHRVAVLAFVDLDNEASIRLRGRLNMVAARRMDPAHPKKFGAGVLDVARHARVAEALAIKSLPALVVFVEGQVEDRLMGLVPETVMDEVIGSRLDPHGD